MILIPRQRSVRWPTDSDYHVFTESVRSEDIYTNTCFIVLSVNIISSNILKLGRNHAKVILLSLNRMSL